MHPHIKYEDKIYYQVGCRKCGKGECWLIFRNDDKFLAKCKYCNHHIIIQKSNIYTKPKNQNVYDGRMF